MSEPSACAGTPDGLHRLELVPQDDGGYKAKCEGCDHWLSQKGLEQFLNESRNSRRYIVGEPA